MLRVLSNQAGRQWNQLVRSVCRSRHAADLVIEELEDVLVGEEVDGCSEHDRSHASCLEPKSKRKLPSSEAHARNSLQRHWIQSTDAHAFHRRGDLLNLQLNAFATNRGVEVEVQQYRLNHTFAICEVLALARSPAAGAT